LQQPFGIDNFVQSLPVVAELLAVFEFYSIDSISLVSRVQAPFYFAYRQLLAGFLRALTSKAAGAVHSSTYGSNSRVDEVNIVHHHQLALNRGHDLVLACNAMLGS
jgi:hypothetical protein